MNKQTFAITTAIDYPNGAPHLGHAYEKTVTDAYARWHRLLGYDVFFETGTDENGQKLVKSAETSGQSTMEYVNSNVAIFKDLCQKLNISYDDFIRTTEPRHLKTTHAIWKKLEDKGDIYFSKYQGQYCLACEAFYTELQAPNNKCPEHHTALDTVEEEGFFFKTSQYQSWIIDLIKKNPTFVVPEVSRKEILSRLEAEPMKDLSISRPAAGWGIPVPGKPEHVIYTWFDALINYKTATETPGREKYWPSDVHVIGRDILWFHAVIWPMMLHASGIPLPKQVYVHGMVLAEDGKKMSKSLNNGVDPFDVMQKVPVDSFRYYMLRAIPAGGNGAFVFADLIKRHTSELGNDFGNLLMRMVKLYRKRHGDLPEVELSVDPSVITLKFDGLVEDLKKSMDAREHHRALERLWQEVNAVNSYINDQAPWAIKEDAEKFKNVIANGVYGFYVLSQLAWSFIPESAEKALHVLGHKIGTLDLNVPKFTLLDPPVLFPRIEVAPAADTQPVAPAADKKNKK